jgi:serine/threonine-protein kinase
VKREEQGYNASTIQGVGLTERNTIQSGRHTTTDSIPKKVGRYELLKRIAIGGMAEVFVAVERGDLDFERLVVIKRILFHLAEDQRFMDMFIQEARIAAQINHPNVVQIYGLGSEGGLPYIAMEHVDGSTLKDLARACQDAGRVVPVDVAVGLAIQACAGAHAAHELIDAHGTRLEIVHRDLSPHNLMVTQEGHLKVLDFGIAKATQGMDKTRTGVLKGKISYLSPEQCQQDGIDRRSDLFTLAGVFWELLCFERAFQGKSDLNTMQNIVTGKHGDMRDLRPDVPESIVEVLERALAVQPQRRFATAGDMRRALLEAAAQEGLQTDIDTIGSFVSQIITPDMRARIDTQSLMRDTIPSLPMGTSLGQTYPKKPRHLLWLTGLSTFLGTGVLVFALLMAIFSVTPPDEPEFPYTVEPNYAGAAIRIQLAPTIDSHVLLKDLEPVRRYLSHRMQRPVEMKVGSSYQDSAKQLLTGQVDFALLPPFIYTKTHTENPKVRVIATKVWEGSSGSDSVLLVRADDPVSDVEQLRGKKICHSDRNSTTSYVLARAFLVKNQINPDTEMSAHISGNHLQVIRDILAEKCDVGAIYTGAYLAAQTEDIDVASVRVLGVAGRTPHDAFCVGPNTDPSLETAVLEALVALSPPKDLGVERVGTVERLTGFDQADDSLYDPLREAIGLSTGEAIP